MKEQVNKFIEEWLRELFKDLPEEEFNTAMEEGRLLAEQAGFTFKTPTEKLIEQIEAYDNYQLNEWEKALAKELLEIEKRMWYGRNSI